ncbi:hypothetical protein FJY84_02840 [Candidatus Bathyarchaeota archaeon]|nr:hypothetical protein [Candidatus Bathyarchaeota archaeon]
MSFTRRTYNEVIENILSQITKGVINEKFIANTSQTKYKFVNTPVKDIVKVTGIRNGVQIIFNKEIDYKLSGDMIEWTQNGEKPDDKTPFFVNYLIGGVTNITDANPGSVIRTIVEAVGRELDFLYAQMNYMYLSGYVDTATGSALDLVVSLLGIIRKQAEPATGLVTFGRNTEPGTLNVATETHLYDKRIIKLNKSPIKKITKVEGTASGKTTLFKDLEDFTLREDSIVWIESGKNPDNDSTFYVDYVTEEQIIIPVGSRVSTYTRKAEEAKVFTTLEEKILVKTPEGRWEADVPVKSNIPGINGNVYAGSLSMMPQPLVGVEYVINRSDILSGTDIETDEDLRVRVKHALEVAGKATMTSIESGIKGIEGVSSVLIEEMPDGVPGIIRVIVQGGSEVVINNVIENTRAAGIKVEMQRPKTVNVNLKILAVIRAGADEAKATRELESNIRSYFSALDIGEDLVYNRIISSAFSVKEIYDVEEMELSIYREKEEPMVIQGNVAIKPEEIVLIREVSISTKRAPRGS